MHTHTGKKENDSESKKSIETVNLSSANQKTRFLIRLEINF